MRNYIARRTKGDFDDCRGHTTYCDGYVMLDNIRVKKYQFQRRKIVTMARQRELWKQTIEINSWNGMENGVEAHPK